MARLSTTFMYRILSDCKSVRANNCPAPLFHRESCPKVICRQYSVTCPENMESMRLGLALWDQRTTRVQNRDSAERVLRCRPDPRTSHTAFSSPHRATVGVWSWLVLGVHDSAQQILDDFLLALRVCRRRRMLSSTANSCTCSRPFSSILVEAVSGARAASLSRCRFVRVKQVSAVRQFPSRHFLDSTTV